MNVPQLLAGGAADFGIGSNSFIALNLVKQNVPLRAVMAVFQKDPQVLITHPRRDLNSLAEMRGKPILISDAAMTSFWPWLKAQVRHFSDSQIRKYTFNLAPFLVDPNAIQEGYLTSEPFTIEQQAHFTPKVFLLADYGYPGYANMVLVPQKWIDTNPKAVQAFYDATPRRLARLSQRQSRARQCADQARQSRHDGRDHRPGDRQDETLSAGVGRRRAGLRRGRHDGQALARISTRPCRARGFIPRAWITPRPMICASCARSLQNFQ